MELILDEYVMYGAAGICKFKGTETKCFDGKTKNEYLTLEPVDSDKSVYYVPQKMLGVKVRKLMTKDEVDDLINSIPEIEPCNCPDRNERKLIFSSVIKSDDVKRIISLIKSLYIKQQDKSSIGKQLSSMEETAMKACENLIYQEMAIVLDMDFNDVRDQIAQKMEESA